MREDDEIMRILEAWYPRLRILAAGALLAGAFALGYLVAGPLIWGAVS